MRSSGKGEIVALSSRSLEKARKKAEQWNIPTAYGCHEQLLQDKNINIVYISNVNTAHYRWTMKKVLQRLGKHPVRGKNGYKNTYPC